MAYPPPSSYTAKIGSDANFWLYSSITGFDLTHPPSPSFPIPESQRLTISTTSKPIAIDPAKTALLIIDMQNFFLSPALGRDAQGAGHKALHQLREHAVPAARKAGVRVVWVNWGLTDAEVESMPPGVTRAFGFEAFADDQVGREGFGVDKLGDIRRVESSSSNEAGATGAKVVSKGLGSPCGTVLDPTTGQELDAGRLLMRDSWNAALCPPLDSLYSEGAALASTPDVWVHKNRMSALWGSGSALETFLEKEGIRTLLFSGVNTDQCVGGTLQDAFSKGYDCVLLGDGSGTTSPEYAQQCMEFNAGRTWGFSTSCRDFAEGVGKMAGGA